MRSILASGAVGLGLGLALSRIGFSSWDEVHRMFTFADLRLVLVFATGVGILAVAWKVVAALSAPGLAWPRKALLRGTIPGGVLFGIGWALCGACPGISLVQLGEGQLLALVTLLGIVVGNWICALVQAKILRWDQGACSGE